MPTRALLLILLFGSPIAGQAEDLILLLRQRNCPDCRLEDVDLVHTDLRDADLRRAQLQRANLGQARLDGADLRKSNLQFTNLAPTMINDRGTPTTAKASCAGDDVT